MKDNWILNVTRRYGTYFDISLSSAILTSVILVQAQENEPNDADESPFVNEDITANKDDSLTTQQSTLNNLSGSETVTPGEEKEDECLGDEHYDSIEQICVPNDEVDDSSSVERPSSDRRLDMNQQSATETPASNASSSVTSDPNSVSNLTAGNSPPTTLDQDVPFDANSSSIGITLSGTDLDRDNLRAAIITPPIYGYLSEISQVTGTVSYSHVPCGMQYDSFTFKVNDGIQDSNNVVTVTLVPNTSTSQPSSRAIGDQGQLAIDKKYLEKRDVLGLPVSSYGNTPYRKGQFRHFRGGSIYYFEATGAHEVRGAIYQEWKSLNWEKSFLGYPITDELPAKDGKGKYNDFQGGAIYFSEATGAH